MDDKTRLEGLEIAARFAKRDKDKDRLADLESQIDDLKKVLEAKDNKPDDEKTYKPSKQFRGAWEEAPADKKRLEQADDPKNQLAKKTGELEAAAMPLDDKVSHEGGDLPALNDTPSAEEVDEGARASTVDESHEVEDTEPAAAPAEKSDAPAKRGPGRPKSTK